MTLIEIPDYKKSIGKNGEEIYDIRATIRETGEIDSNNFQVTKYTNGNISFSNDSDAEGFFYIYKDQLEILNKLGIFKNKKG